jgi:ATP-dependent DNA helicase Q1
MPDLLKILRLAPICDGRGAQIVIALVYVVKGTAANSSGTVFFSAPLFRPNLLYRVLPKPSSAKAAIEKMGQWINDHHPYVQRQ